MNRKKAIPLLVVAGAVVLLSLALLLLKIGSTADSSAEQTLCPFPAEKIDELSYQGDNADVTLLKGSEGNWLLESDPALPLDQTSVQSLVEKFASLTAQRSLQDDELGEIPARSETPLMVFEITSGEKTWSLTVDQENDVADVYYVYDADGKAYTVAKSDVSGICKEPRELYAPQTLTEQTLDDAVALQVEDLNFVLTDDVWTLADDPEYPLEQSAVKKMINTICGLETEWSITAPESDAAYGLDSPDVTASVTFSDGSTLTVRFGNSVPDDESCCYLASSEAPTLVYEVDADHKNAFAVTKESLYDDEATAETAQEGDVVAQYPVGGRDDYADSIQ